MQVTSRAFFLVYINNVTEKYDLSFVVGITDNSPQFRGLLNLILW